MIYIIIVVDDTLITSSDLSKTIEVEKAILSRFPGSSGNAEWYCGMKLSWQLDGSVRITQESHIDKVILQCEKFGHEDKFLPAPTNAKWTSVGEPLDVDVHPYASIVGALLFIACNSRPDISSTVNKLTKYMSDPKQNHWNMLMYLVGYLRRTKSMGLHLGNSDLITSYCDADHATDLDKRRSHTGWCFILYGGAVSWQSKCQQTVATSTTEAEYQAASGAAREALWLRQLYIDLNIPASPMVINCDSLGAISSLNRFQVSQRTKHIDVIHHFVRERAQLKQIKFDFVKTNENIADVLTKPVVEKKHFWCCNAMGMW
jgi:hypothetical protein